MAIIHGEPWPVNIYCLPWYIVQKYNSVGFPPVLKWTVFVAHFSMTLFLWVFGREAKQVWTYQRFLSRKSYDNDWLWVLFKQTYCCAPQVHIFINLHVEIGQINWILWLDLSCFPNLALIKKIMVIWNRNWAITMINAKWPRKRCSHYCSPSAWDDPNLRNGLTLCLSRMRDMCYFCGEIRDFGGGYCETVVFSLYPWVNKLW